MRVLALTFACLTISACTQTMRFRSDPPGARVSVNGKFVGITPAWYEMSEWAVPDMIHYKVERGGYLPQEGEVRPRFSVGRMFGAIFTIGLVYVLRSPYVYDGTYDFPLARLDDTRDVESEPLRIDERLRRLDGLRSQGLITEKEYQEQRAAILHGL